MALTPVFAASASRVSPRLSRSSRIRAPNACQPIPVLTVSCDSADVKGSEGAEDIVHDRVDVAAPVVAVGGHPAIELRAADQDLPANAVAEERMLGERQAIAELPDAEAAVHGERLEREERVERRRDDHALGQHAADLGDALLHRARLPSSRRPGALMSPVLSIAACTAAVISNPYICANCTRATAASPFSGTTHTCRRRSHHAPGRTRAAAATTPSNSKAISSAISSPPASQRPRI